MKYTVEYLKRQLEETTKVCSDLNAKLKADPKNRALKISARSMNDHVKEIQRDLDEAELAQGYSENTVTSGAEEHCPFGVTLDNVKAIDDKQNKRNVLAKERDKRTDFWDFISSGGNIVIPKFGGAA